MKTVNWKWCIGTVMWLAPVGWMFTVILLELGIDSFIKIIYGLGIAVLVVVYLAIMGWLLDQI